MCYHIPAYKDWTKFRSNTFRWYWAVKWNKYNDMTVFRFTHRGEDHVHRFDDTILQESFILPKNTGWSNKHILWNWKTILASDFTSWLNKRIIQQKREIQDESFDGYNMIRIRLIWIINDFHDLSTFFSHWSQSTHDIQSI